ncbi:Asp-tRNA(Asn)/Glu-tRNA(Gln) amidotransferase subunit GatB [Salinispira pacifica]|nr:Asp-tRNA(Asn)/Glu-tRNA(Gln) amidotransferase subunit GatB [Salinispira pacifica]
MGQIKEKRMYQSFIGLEIHVQLTTESKVFCSCKNHFGDEPNTNVCPVCMGLPGSLPALNEEAIKKSYAVARALNCRLSEECVFERKNYFYPDLPKNYQISQFEKPLGTDGYIDIEFNGKKKRVRIHECHLEEDAGKMVHAGDMSLLDFNRTGTPLLEIVTEPDLELAEEAEVLIQELRRIVRYLGVSDGNMEEGSMRADANVSINPAGQGLGNKVEVKNLNSSRFVRKSLSFEISRQSEIMEKGGTIVQETRLWNENRDQTEIMRTKENANDYRYFPEPDLPPFRTDKEFLSQVEDLQVELPLSRRDRYRNDYGLNELQADFICDEKFTADFFEECIQGGADPLQLVSWLSSDVQKELNRHGMVLEHSPLSSRRLVEMLQLLTQGRIHGKIAKQVLQVIFEEDKDPETIIRERNWEQITDSSAIQEIIDGVLNDFPKAVQEIQAGDSKPVKFLIGKVMQASSGRAEPKKVQQLLSSSLQVRTLDILSFGGAISGTRRGDGFIEPGDMLDIRKYLARDGEIAADLRFEEIQMGKFLSEELSPEDWAALVHRIFKLLKRGSNGILIAHGTDTLAYTAALLHWFFGSSNTPILLTAAVNPLEEDSSGVDHLKNGIMELEAAGRKGWPDLDVSGPSSVRVSVSGRVYPAYNLKFRNFEDGEQLFSTWNQNILKKTESNADLDIDRLDELPELDYVTSIFEQILKRVALVKIYPGMQSSLIKALIDQGVNCLVLELYDSGTANLSQSPFSIREALEYGKAKGVRFYCTSQQEGLVDFADYVTSHQLWKEGARAMGPDSSESAFARVIAEEFAAQLEKDDKL